MNPMNQSTGFTTPLNTGTNSVPLTGSGFSNPLTSSTGYTAPINTGYTAPMNTGYNAPMNTGYSAPMNTGYSAPMNTGFSPITGGANYAQQVQSASQNVPEFHLRVVQARNLFGGDLMSQSDPYVVVRLKGFAHLFKNEKQQSGVVWDNNNPVWNQDFLLHPTKTNDIIEVRIYDRDKMGKDTLLGKALIPVAQYLNRGVFEQWLPLVGKKGAQVRGEIHISCNYGFGVSNLLGKGQGISSIPVSGYGSGLTNSSGITSGLTNSSGITSGLTSSSGYQQDPNLVTKITTVTTESYGTKVPPTTGITQDQPFTSL